MNNRYVKESFSYWTTNPDDIADADIPYLKEAAELYPYCQTLHILAAKAIAMHQPELAEASIQKAAAYSLSRNTLRKLIQNEFEWSPNLRSRQFENVLIWPADYQKTAVSPLAKPHWQLPELPKIDIFDEPVILSRGSQEKVTLPELPPIDDTTLRENALQNELEQIESSTVEEDQQAHLELERQRQMAIIDSFIENEARMGPIRANLNDMANVEPEDLAKKRNMNFSEGIVSEGMAKIMARQGKIERAIEIYEQLMLKKPEKKAYFAEKIKDLTTE
jgi:tetratricopeptide (TPR) repeat protein